MNLFGPRVRYTDAPAEVVAFFLQQYVEVMKHAKDKTDAKMKDYLFAVIEGLGVPEHAAEQKTLSTESEELPVIHRRSNDG